MADLLPFRQTAISAAIRTLRIPSRPPETAQEEKAQMDATQTIAESEEMPQRPEYSAWMEFLALDESAPPPSPVIFSTDAKREQAELVRVIGDRLREARELCNLSQSEAARRFGYANPSKLSKVELVTDTNSVPLWLIVRAARMYEVSIDFLFGLTDDWEIGVPRGVQSFMFDVWEKARQRDMAALEHLHREVVAVSLHTAELVAGIAGATEALAALRTRSPAFDDLPASASLAGRLERLQKRAHAADAALRRFRLGLSPDASRNGPKGATR